MQKKATIKIYQDRECVIQSALTRWGNNLFTKLYPYILIFLAHSKVIKQ